MSYDERGKLPLLPARCPLLFLCLDCLPSAMSTGSNYVDFSHRRNHRQVVRPAIIG
jgi:hypothetical protein